MALILELKGGDGVFIGGFGDGAEGFCDVAVFGLTNGLTEGEGEFADIGEFLFVEIALDVDGDGELARSRSARFAVARLEGEGLDGLCGERDFVAFGGGDGEIERARLLAGSGACGAGVVEVCLLAAGCLRKVTDSHGASLLLPISGGEVYV